MTLRNLGTHILHILYFNLTDLISCIIRYLKTTLRGEKEFNILE